MRKRLIASIVAAGLALAGVIAAPAFAETNLKGAGSSFANKFITSCAVKNPQYSVTYIPVVGGPVAILFNVPGVTSGSLKLNATVWANILTGKVKMWNDASIKKLQSAAVAKKLPAKPIRVVYRSSNSGTSENMTNYLRQVVPAIWTRPKNGTIAQGNPAGRMPAGAIGAPNSQSLVTSVKSMSYTIGYADLSDTVDAAGKPKVAVAQLQNANGEFVAPSSAAASKFLEVFSNRNYPNATTGAVNFNYTTKIAGAYQMSLMTYAIADKGATSSTAGDVEAFVSYLLSDCGPNYAASLGYSPITGDLKTKALALAAAIKQ